MYKSQDPSNQITFSKIENPRGSYNTSPPKFTAEAIRLAQPPPELLRSKLQFLAKKMVFRFKPQNDIKIDTRNLLLRSLALLLAEYLLYLAFQLISYFLLDRFWRDSKYITGIILGITYAVLFGLLVLLINKQNKTLLFVLKALEFVTAFLLMGYLVVWDFGVMSLSYIVILDILIIFLAVG